MHQITKRLCLISIDGEVIVFTRTSAGVLPETTSLKASSILIRQRRLLFWFFGYLMHIEIHILADIEKIFSRKPLEYPSEGFNQFWW